MNATLVLAPPAREPDAGLNVSHDWVLDADQLRVVLVAPMFCTRSDCDDVAVLPFGAEKLSVEVGTESTACDAVVNVWSLDITSLPLPFVEMTAKW